MIFEGVASITAWGGYPVKVYHNPSRVTFQTISKLPLRGLVTDKDIWLWNAAQAIHSNVMEELGLPSSTDCVHYYRGKWHGPVYGDEGRYVAPIERLTPRPKPEWSKEDQALLDELRSALQEHNSKTY